MNLQNNLIGSEKQGWLELLMVLITGCLKFILMDWLDMRVFYITGICIFWSGYAYYRYSGNPDILKQWGYRKENFRKSAVILLPIILLGVISSIIYGVLNGTYLFNWHIIPVLILYPVWGVVQQFMMVNLIADNLQNLKVFKLSKSHSIIITAFIFSMYIIREYFLFFLPLLWKLSFFWYFLN